jgi:hypothetical protein
MSEERTTKQRWRCPDDDGTAAHLALDVEQAPNLRVAAEFAAEFAGVRCLCGRTLTMLSNTRISSDVILARRVAREERARAKDGES